MKRYIVLLVIFIAACAVALPHLPPSVSPVVVIEAQLPATVGADLTPVPGATSYKVILNGAVITQGFICPGPAKCTTTFPITTAGSYTLAYVSTTLLLDVDPNSGVDSAPGPSTAFKIVQPAGAPTVAAIVHK